jgi:hypothetical protein
MCGILNPFISQLGQALRWAVVSIRAVHGNVSTQFSLKNQGLDLRLTGVEPARVIPELLA